MIRINNKQNYFVYNDRNNIVIVRIDITLLWTFSKYMNLTCNLLFVYFIDLLYTHGKATKT